MQAKWRWCILSGRRIRIGEFDEMNGISSTLLNFSPHLEMNNARTVLPKDIGFNPHLHTRGKSEIAALKAAEIINSLHPISKQPPQ